MNVSERRVNAIKLLFGMSFVDLSRDKVVCSKDWAEFFLFLADLAKFTKNARNYCGVLP